MIQYEYKYRSVPLTDQQKELIGMNLIKGEELHEPILKIVNEEGQDGWEALYPFMADTVWFRRVREPKKRSTKK